MRIDPTNAVVTPLGHLIVDGCSVPSKICSECHGRGKWEEHKLIRLAPLSLINDGLPWDRPRYIRVSKVCHVCVGLGRVPL